MHLRSLTRKVAAAATAAAPGLLSAAILLLIFAGHSFAAMLIASCTNGFLVFLLTACRIHLARTRAALAAARRRVDVQAHELVVANTDPVTGLPVRRVAERYLAAADDVEMTVAILDVDDMHGINNNHDHQYGDAYLAAVADRLRDLVHDGGLVARLGGDEFLVATPRTIWQLTDELTAALEQPLLIGGRPVPMQVSIGVCQGPGGDVHTALGCADRAMLTAKRRGSVLELYDAARDGIPAPPAVRPAVRRRDRSAQDAAHHD